MTLDQVNERAVSAGLRVDHQAPAFRLVPSSGDAHFEVPAEHARSGFDLVQPRGVAQV